MNFLEETRLVNKMEELVTGISNLQSIVPHTDLHNNNSLVVLIDAGHGGMLNGKYATAPNKMAKWDDLEFYEGVWNRYVAWRLAYTLGQIGASYSIIVPEDNDITLQERIRRAEKIGKQYKSYYLSIHANAAGIESAKGVEVYTSKGDTKADRVATIYYQSLYKLGWKMRNDFSDGDPDKEEDFYVLKETSMPAILTETGFYSNREEAHRMITPFAIHQIVDLFTEAHMNLCKLNIL